MYLQMICGDVGLLGGWNNRSNICVDTIYIIYTAEYKIKENESSAAVCTCAQQMENVCHPLLTLCADNIPKPTFMQRVATRQTISSGYYRFKCGSTHFTLSMHNGYRIESGSPLMSSLAISKSVYIRSEDARGTLFAIHTRTHESPHKAFGCAYINVKYLELLILQHIYTSSTPNKCVLPLPLPFNCSLCIVGAAKCKLRCILDVLRIQTVGNTFASYILKL